jgi:hypothetical protein
MRAGTRFSQLLNLRVFQQYRREADTTERGLESLGKPRLVATAQIGCKTPHVFGRGRVGKTPSSLNKCLQSARAWGPVLLSLWR